MESIEQTFNGTAAFDSSVDCTIARNGDLIHKMYVEYLPTNVITTGQAVRANVGHTLLKEMELEIGGQRIDKHYSHWLTTWTELTDVNPTGSKLTLNAGGSDAKCDLEKAQSITGVLTASSEEATQYQLQSFNHIGVSGFATANRAKKNTAFVPLQFWFCRNVGLSLPLIALQYHEVKVKITFCSANDLCTTNTGSLSDVKLWTDYIYLDTDERRRFAQVSHEYLIEQLQTLTIPGTAGNREINFNHPVKELIWIGKENGTPAANAGPGTPTVVSSDATTKYK